MIVNMDNIVAWNYFYTEALVYILLQWEDQLNMSEWLTSMPSVKL